MVTSCCAFGCTNRKVRGSKIQFHRFPLNPERRIQWTLALKRKGWQPSLSSRVCSDHFTEEDFKPLGSNRLKKDAVPSIFKGFPSYFQKKSSLKQSKVVSSVPATKDLKKKARKLHFPVQTSTSCFTENKLNQSLYSTAVLVISYTQPITETDNKKVVENFPESTNLSYVDNGSSMLSTEEILKQKSDKKSEDKIDENGLSTTNNSDNLSYITNDFELMSPEEILQQKLDEKSEDKIDENGPSSNNSDDLPYIANDSELMSPEEILKKILETGKKKISEDEINVNISESANNSVDLSRTENDSELSSEEILKRKLEIMTTMYEKSQKKLKRCQEQCKFYVKQVIALEEVIDNLKKINSVNDYS